MASPVRSFLERARERFGFFALAALIAAGYAVLRLELNTQYSGASWKALYDLTAPIPFGYRVLIPLLSHPLVAAGLTLRSAYLFWEIVSTFFLFVGLERAFRFGLGTRWSPMLAVAFVGFLPWAFLLRTRWPIFYPYDTPAMALLAWAIALALEQRWVALVAATFVASVNRESAFLIPAVFLALFIDRLSVRQLATWTAGLTLAHLAGRAVGIVAALGNPRPYGGGFAWTRSHQVRFNENLRWIWNGENAFALLATLGFLPLLWLALRSDVPVRLRRLAPIAAAYLGMLLFIGNPYEPRIFGEAMVLLYVAIGYASWARVNGEHAAILSEPPVREGRLARAMRRVDAAAAWLVVGGLLVGAAAVNWALRSSAH